MATSVLLYNNISDGDGVTVEDVANGVFKWMDESEIANYSKGLYAKYDSNDICASVGTMS